MKIIFYDGTCPMCNSWVKRIIRWDKKAIFKYSPLEGTLAEKKLTPLLPDYLKEDTIVLFDEGKIYLRSDAALHIAKQLGFPYNLGWIGNRVPKTWRDGIYRWVANRRYRYGKRYEVCPVPPAGWRERFL